MNSGSKSFIGLSGTTDVSVNTVGEEIPFRLPPHVISSPLKIKTGEEKGSMEIHTKSMVESSGNPANSQPGRHASLNKQKFMRYYSLTIPMSDSEERSIIGGSHRILGQSMVTASLANASRQKWDVSPIRTNSANPLNDSHQRDSSSRNFGELVECLNSFENTLDEVFRSFSGFLHEYDELVNAERGLVKCNVTKPQLKRPPSILHENAFIFEKVGLLQIKLDQIVEQVQLLGSLQGTEAEFVNRGVGSPKHVETTLGREELMLSEEEMTDPTEKVVRPKTRSQGAVIDVSHVQPRTLEYKERAPRKGVSLKIAHEEKGGV